MAPGEGLRLRAGDGAYLWCYWWSLRAAHAQRLFCVIPVLLLGSCGPMAYPTTWEGKHGVAFSRIFQVSSCDVNETSEFRKLLDGAEAGLGYALGVLQAVFGASSGSRQCSEQTAFMVIR